MDPSAPDVAVFADQLADGDSDVRASATQLLEKLDVATHTEVASALAAKFDDEDEEHRHNGELCMRALRAMGELGGAALVPHAIAIGRCVRYDDPIQQVAMDLISELNAATQAAFASAVFDEKVWTDVPDHDESMVKQAILDVLSLLDAAALEPHASAIVAILVDFGFHDEHWHTAVDDILSKLETNSAIGRCLVDRDSNVRESATELWAIILDRDRHGGSFGIDLSIIAVVANGLAQMLDDDVPEVRQHALDALGEMDPTNDLDDLEPHVSAIGRRLADGDSNVRKSAAEVLGEMDLATKPAVASALAEFRRKEERERAGVDHLMPKRPEDHFCGICAEVMQDPVTDALGHTYERASIERWLHDHNTSPATNEQLPHRQLAPNHVLKSLINDWAEDAHKQCMTMAHAVAKAVAEVKPPPLAWQSTADLEEEVLGRKQAKEQQPVATGKRKATDDPVMHRRTTKEIEAEASRYAAHASLLDMEGQRRRKLRAAGSSDAASSSDAATVSNVDAAAANVDAAAATVDTAMTADTAIDDEH